jgi:DNA-binding beta-propeller fold protein YncE
MILRNAAMTLVVLACLVQFALPQNIDTQLDPPSVVFKDSTGTVVTSIPVDKHYVSLDLTMKVSIVAKMAYVLNAEGKSSKRSVSAVNLTTLRVDRVIDVGEGGKVKLLISRDGHRLLCYRVSGAVEKGSGSGTVVAIDTASNEVIGRLELVHNPHVALPDAKSIGSIVSATSDGGFVFLVVTGYGRRGPDWERLVVFPVNSPNSAFVVDPGKPIVSLRLSQNEKFLFVAAADRDRAEIVDIVNLEKGTSISRDIANPPTRNERLGRFLGGVPPSRAESKQGIWVFTRTGLRFISEDGEIGNELALPREENVAAILSLDRKLLFVAVPDYNQNTGVLDIVNLQEGTSSNRPLAEAPIRLGRLGPASALWIMGNREMRPVSETGELSDRAIALNKPHKTEGGETNGTDAFLNGNPGETISLGEDRAAILITSKKGGTLHRVALLDLKRFQLDGVLAVMSRGEQSKIARDRFFTVMAAAALVGSPFAPGAGEVLWTGLTGGPANETLAASPDGRKLYVLDTDTHELSVIDVETAAIVRRTEVDHSVTTIQVALDGRHLICAGASVLHTVDLEPNQKAN